MQNGETGNFAESAHHGRYRIMVGDHDGPNENLEEYHLPIFFIRDDNRSYDIRRRNLQY